jgi:hypothetical protein
MKKNLILFAVSGIVLLIYVSIDFFSQRREIFSKEKVHFKISSLEVVDIENLIKKQLKPEEIEKTLGDWELWRYMKPEVEEEKTQSKQYIQYEVRRKGNREIIVNPLNRQEAWEFYGVFIINKRPFAIFYNKYAKEGKYKVVTIGDKLNDDLIIDKITSSKIVVKFPVGENKYDKLELKVFYVDIEQFKKKLERESKR